MALFILMDLYIVPFMCPRFGPDSTFHDIEIPKARRLPDKGSQTQETAPNDQEFEQVRW